jgi:hypothetical protein
MTAQLLRGFPWGFVSEASSLAAARADRLQLPAGSCEYGPASTRMPHVIAPPLCPRAAMRAIIPSPFPAQVRMTSAVCRAASLEGASWPPSAWAGDWPGCGMDSSRLKLAGPWLPGLGPCLCSVGDQLTKVSVDNCFKDAPETG